MHGAAGALVVFLALLGFVKAQPDEVSFAIFDRLTVKVQVRDYDACRASAAHLESCVSIDVLNLRTVQCFFGDAW